MRKHAIQNKTQTRFWMNSEALTRIALTQTADSVRQRLSRFTSRLITLLLVASLTASCGFQLRGQASFDFQTIGRDGMTGTNMARTLDRLMEVYGLQVNAGTSEAVITLLGESIDRSILTFSATGRAEEVRLIYSVRYRVKDAKGKFLIADSVISQDRDLTYDDGQILGKELEEARLIQEMQNDISRQIVRRLSALKLSKG